MGVRLSSVFYWNCVFLVGTVDVGSLLLLPDERDLRIFYSHIYGGSLFRGLSSDRLKVPMPLYEQMYVCHIYHTLGCLWFRSIANSHRSCPRNSKRARALLA